MKKTKIVTESGLMKCPKCGGSLIGDEERCPWCGSPIPFFKPPSAISYEELPIGKEGPRYKGLPSVFARREGEPDLVPMENFVVEISESGLNEIVLSAVELYPCEVEGLLFGTLSPRRASCVVSKALRFTITSETAVGAMPLITEAEKEIISRVQKSFTGMNFIGTYHSHISPERTFDKLLKALTKERGKAVEDVLRNAVHEIAHPSWGDKESLIRCAGELGRVADLRIGLIELPFKLEEPVVWRNIDPFTLACVRTVPLNVKPVEDVLMQYKEEEVDEILSEIVDLDFRDKFQSELQDYIEEYGGLYIPFLWVMEILSRPELEQFFSSKKKRQELLWRIEKNHIEDITKQYRAKDVKLEEKRILYTINAAISDGNPDHVYEPAIRLGRTQEVVRCPLCGAVLKPETVKCPFCSTPFK